MKRVKILMASIAVLLITALASTIAMASGGNISTYYYYTKGGLGDDHYVEKPSNKYEIAFDYDGSFKRYKSSNPKVATVKVRKTKDEGRTVWVLSIVAHKPGKAVISWTHNNGEKEKRSITVKKYKTKFTSLKLGNLNLLPQAKKTDCIILPYNKYKGKTLKISAKCTGAVWYYFVFHKNVLDPYTTNDGEELGYKKNYAKFKVTKRGCGVHIDCTNDSIIPGMHVTIVFK